MCGIALQVIASLLPGRHKLLGLGHRDLEDVDQHDGFGHGGSSLWSSSCARMAEGRSIATSNPRVTPAMALPCSIAKRKTRDRCRDKLADTSHPRTTGRVELHGANDQSFASAPRTAKVAAPRPNPCRRRSGSGGRRQTLPSRCGWCVGRRWASARRPALRGLVRGSSGWSFLGASAMPG